VILDKSYQPQAIYEAPREVVLEALQKTDSKARARGTLSISQVKRLSSQCWPIQPAIAG